MPSTLAAHVQPAQLLAHLRALEGERHHVSSPAALRAAQDYVGRHWRRLGYTCVLQEFSYSREGFVNVIARRPDAPDGPRLIVGAHLDTVPGTPGADDNASGVAVLLECARLLAAAPRLRHPVDFVGFALEEEGLLGSAHFADSLRRARAPVLGMLALEMLGYTERAGQQQYPWFLRGRFPAHGTYLGVAGNRRSRHLLQTVADAMRCTDGLAIETLTLPGAGWLFPEARLSDHAPFWDRGYPALLLTDTAMFRNPHYHRPTDTVDTLDLVFLERVCRGVVAAVEALVT